MYGFNNGYYQPQQNYQYRPNNQQNNNGGINWVQGITGAKAYVVEPNASVFLMDSEKSVFYIKSADASGMPLPLRVFDYTERTQDQISQDQQNLNDTYVTRQEFNNMLQKLESMRKKMIPQQAPAKLSVEGADDDGESFI